MKQWIKRALRIGSRINNSTSGSVLHVDSNNKVAEDNSNFFWDIVNKVLQVPKLRGGDGAGEDLTLQSTSNATKGKIYLGANSVYDESTDQLGINKTSGLDVDAKLHLVYSRPFHNIAVFENSTSGQVRMQLTRSSDAGTGINRGTVLFNYSGGTGFADYEGNGMQFWTSLVKGTQASPRFYVKGNGDVSVGISAPTAKFHVKGVSSTSSAYALKLDDSSNSNLFSVRNDGLVVGSGILEIPTVRGGDGASEDLTLSSTSNATKGKIYLGANSVYDEVNDRLGIGVTNAQTLINARNDVIAQISARSGANFAQFFAGSSFYPSIVWNTGVDFRFGPANNEGDTGGYIERMRITSDGLLAVGTLTPTARIHIKGSGNTSSTYAVKVDNSDDSNLLSVRNDGVFTTNGARVKDYEIHTGADTLTNSDVEIQYGDTDGGAFTLTLPASPTDGLIFTIKNTGGSANDLTIGRNGKTIDGDTSDLPLIDAEVVEIQYTTDGWKII